MKEKYMNSQINEILQKSVRIFQMQVLGQQNRAKITPLYVGFEELKMRCEKMIKNQGKTEQKDLSSKLFYPVVLIDYKTSSEAFQNDKNTELDSLSQFSQILKNSQSYEGNFGSQRNSEVSFSKDLKDKLLSSSSSLTISRKKSQTTSFTNDNLFITVKPLTPQFSDKINQENQNMNIILIHLKLFKNIEKLSRLSEDLLSLGIYLSDHMVINFIGSNKQQSFVAKFAECLEQKVREIKNSGQKIKKYRADFITSQEIKMENAQNLSFIKFHPNNKGKKELARTLEKIKNDIQQRLSFKFFDLSAQNQMKLQSFLKKCEIAARILSNPTKKSLFFSQDLFSQLKITEKEKQLSKETDLGEQRLIRQRFECFYNSLRFGSKKEFPIHCSVVDFKIDEFCRELKEKVTNKRMLDRISKEYRQKIQEVNGKEIKKLLQGSLKEYLLGRKQHQGNDSVKYHPEKVELLINQYGEIVKSSYPFITEEIFTSIAYNRIYSAYYARLYEEYKKMKRKNDENDKIFEEKTLTMRKELEEFTARATRLEQQNEKQQFTLQGLTQEIHLTNKQKTRLNDQLIVWKQKAIDAQQLLVKQQQANKQLNYKIEMLQQKLTQHQQKKVQSLLLGGTKNHQQPSSIIITGQQLLSMQQTITKENNMSQTLMTQFQTHLKNYKNQYHQMENQLKEKQKYLISRQSYYKEKICLLQAQLQMKNNSLSMEKDKEINIMKQHFREQIEKQYEEKLLWKQTQQQKKILNYQLNLEQLESIIKSNHENINYLNQEIYKLKKIKLECQDSLDKQINRMKDIQRMLGEKVKQNQSKDFIIAQNERVIQQLTLQNHVLSEKINEKTVKLEMLQYNIEKLSTKAFNNNNLNNNNNFQTVSINNNNKKQRERQRNNSFLRFQTQQNEDRTFIDNSSIFINDVTTKSAYSNNATPMKRSCSKLKQRQTMNEIKENIQLEKLIEQRKTIEKRKEKCAKREMLLQNLQRSNSVLMKSIIKQGSAIKIDEPFFSNQSTIYNQMISGKSQMNNKILKQSNRAAKYDMGMLLDYQNDQKLRKKLFQ